MTLGPVKVEFVGVKRRPTYGRLTPSGLTFWVYVRAASFSQDWPCVSRRESIQEERGQTPAESGRHTGTRERGTLAGSAGSPQCNVARLVYLLRPRGLLPGISSCHTLRL